MEGKGIVKYIDDQKIVISAYKKSSCDKCKTCTEGGKFESECEFKVKEKLDIKKGDTVLFHVKDKKILQYSFLIYIFPIFGFFLGNYLTTVIFKNSTELLQVIGSFIGMGIFLLIVSLLDKHLGETFLESIDVVK